MGIKSRVKEYIASKNIKKLEFYKIIQVSNGYLDKDGCINSDVLASIITHFPDINIHWLLFDKGSMYIEKKTTHNESCDEKCALKDYVIELQKEKIHDLESKLNLNLHKTYQS
jgi:hypothetical protein